MADTNISVLSTHMLALSSDPPFVENAQPHHWRRRTNLVGGPSPAEFEQVKAEALKVGIIIE